MKQTKHFKNNIPLLVLLLVDIMLIILHIINFYHPFENRNLYDMGRNDSYAEDYQNLKWIIIILALLIITLTKTEIRYLAWVWVFIFLFLEDVMRIHEYFTGLLPYTILTEIILGIVVIAPVALVYKKSSALFKKHSKAIFILLCIFMFFGIFIDQIHRLLLHAYNWKSDLIAGIFEDGGEMISESLLTGYLLSIAIKKSIRP